MQSLACALAVVGWWSVQWYLLGPRTGQASGRRGWLYVSLPTARLYCGFICIVASIFSGGGSKETITGDDTIGTITGDDSLNL